MCSLMKINVIAGMPTWANFTQLQGLVGESCDIFLMKAYLKDPILYVSMLITVIYLDPLVETNFASALMRLNRHKLDVFWAPIQF